jgi:hypothetical protein
MATREAPETVFKHERVVLVTYGDGDEAKVRVDGAGIRIASSDEVYG